MLKEIKQKMTDMLEVGSTNNLEEVPQIPGALLMWHMPEVASGEKLYIPVISPEQGQKFIFLFNDYDHFLLKNNLRADFTNASGLLVYKDEQWKEWYNDMGESITEVTFGEREPDICDNLCLPGDCSDSE